MPSNYTPTSDAEVESVVRAITGYDDSELPSKQFQTLLDLTKLTLVNETNLSSTQGNDDPWYSDDGLGQALVFTAAIRTKVAVENYSVDRWDFGDQTLDVRGAGDADQIQFQEWMERANDGLDASNKADDDTPIPSNTSSYIT